METVKLRRDFMRLRNGRWRRTPRIDIQACKRSSTLPADQEPLRFGLIVSKKVGNAVVRNRAKRRLRAAIRHLQPTLVKHMQNKHLYAIDVGLVARPVITQAPFCAIVDDISVGTRQLFHTLDGNTNNTPATNNKHRSLSHGLKVRRYKNIATSTLS